MKTLIQGGTVVTATETVAADVLVDGEKVAAIGNGMAVEADRTIDATGRYVMPGAIDVHTHMDLPVRRELLLGRLRHRHACGSLRRHHHDRRLRAAGLRREPAHRARSVAREGAEVAHRLRLPHDRAGGQRPGTEGDGHPRRRRRHVLQALHGLPGRVHAGRRGDLPGDAARGRLGRADHDARRERRPDRRLDPAVPPAGEDGSGQSRPDASAGDGGRGRPPSVQDGRACRRARLHRPSVVAGRARRGPRRARSGRRGLRGDVSRNTCISRSTTWLGPASRARSSSARRRSARPTIRTSSGRGCVADDLQVVSTDHAPFNYRGQKDLGKDDFSKIPNGLPSVEDRFTLLYQGVVDGRIGLEPLRGDRRDGARPRCSASIRGRERSPPGSTRTSSIFDPEHERTISAETHHMNVDYSCYEGRAVKGLPRDRDAARERPGRERRVPREGGAGDVPAAEQDLGVTVDVERLRRLPLFGELDHHDLSTIAHHVGETEASEGQVLFEQGSIPYEMFVIEEGTAEVTKDGQTVGTIGPGDVVGEIALLRFQRRMATVRVTSPHPGGDRERRRPPGDRGGDARDRRASCARSWRRASGSS